ncbi:MAG: ADP-ribosylglycohydrolase family protein [Elusimicrobia bacterium]|nr:ADP-ribosylglycohydrolase family protein [Elusimicrobiota bacterium]
MKEKYLYIENSDLKYEQEQVEDEGKDISSVISEFEELSKLNLDEDLSLQTRAQRLLDKTVNLPTKPGYKFLEPSDLEGIKKERPDGPRKIALKVNDKILFDKVLGAWLGRCSGCLLGKPVEHWLSPQMWKHLKDLNRYPLTDYFPSDKPIDHMPEDDDLNYTVTGICIIKEFGKDFTPENVARFWMTNMPILHTYSAERVTYKNLVNLIQPPQSAIFRNPYREWIGAQIRADFFGYYALGNPELAAEYAWRDASISHIKNGIYGEMWVAAMLAASAVESDIKKIIKIGLSEIPAKSRLSEGISDVMKWHEEGIDFEEAISRIHKRWDENNPHHWCHTISNAQVVVLGLLWGEGDFEKSICRAVQACFDTDCNGATVGSIVGMILGAKKLPKKWIEPLNDTLETGISGYNSVKISKIAKEGFQLYKNEF